MFWVLELTNVKSSTNDIVYFFTKKIQKLDAKFVMREMFGEKSK